jgi:tripartite-type tricarboxylate transporter receptor subunit TctC
VTRLNGDLLTIMRQPEVKDRLASQGTETIASTPEQLSAHVRTETAKWENVVKRAGIKAD